MSVLDFNGERPVKNHIVGINALAYKRTVQMWWDDARHDEPNFNTKFHHSNNPIISIRYNRSIDVFWTVPGSQKVHEDQVFASVVEIYADSKEIYIVVKKNDKIVKVWHEPAVYTIRTTL